MSSKSALDLYYEGDLPVSLRKWMKAFCPRETLIYRGLAFQQMRFIDREIRGLFTKQTSISVISTHYSCCIKLPVYQIKLEKHRNKIEITLRNNFSDWIVSVNSDFSLAFLFCNNQELFDTTEEVSSYRCDGLPTNKIYGSYANDFDHFTASIADDFKLYTFLFLISDQIRESP